MKITVSNRSYFDWKLVKASDVTEDDVAIPSIHGPDFMHLQVHYLEPNQTEVHVPEADLERMVADHEEGVRNARKGYTTTQVGGPLDGQEVVVAPRNMPLRSRNQLLAKHLDEAVFPIHFPSDAVTKIEIVESGLEPDDQAAIESFLNRQFVNEEAAK